MKPLKFKASPQCGKKSTIQTISKVEKCKKPLAASVENWKKNCRKLETTVKKITLSDIRFC